MIVPRLANLLRLLRGAARTSGARNGLTYAKARILSLLSAIPGTTQVEIADRLGLRAPTVQRHLDALERDGLVVRERSDTDRRKTVVSLTAQGLRMDATRLSAELEAIIVRGIDPDDLSIAVRVIDRMIENLSEGQQP